MSRHPEQEAINLARLLRKEAQLFEQLAEYAEQRANLHLAVRRYNAARYLWIEAARAVDDIGDNATGDGYLVGAAEASAKACALILHG